jgi:hypothetical protein
VVKTLVNGVGAAVLKFFIFDGLFPVLGYLPGIFANRALGFKIVSLDEHASLRLTAQAAAGHPQGTKVRVLCISGRYLFREKTTPAGIEAPLRSLARSGDLEVVMPFTDEKNLTIVARHCTYSAGTKEDASLSQITDLLAEVDKGKEFLFLNHRNEVYEHNMLCMWRLVIFESCCVVQNYFPNTTGVESYKAPTFVFEKTNVINCYYDMFSKMFQMVKESAKRVLPPDATPISVRAFAAANPVPATTSGVDIRSPVVDRVDDDEPEGSKAG